MQQQILAGFYERDLRKYIEEINAFTDEDNLWRVLTGVTNSAGNLTLHIIGGLNHHIGATLGHTGYLRDRDAEFADKHVPKQELIAGLEALTIVIGKVFKGLSSEDMNTPFPKFFDKEDATIGYVLTQLLVHTNYHLGQVNYLRRFIESREV